MTVKELENLVSKLEERTTKLENLISGKDVKTNNLFDRSTIRFMAFSTDCSKFLTYNGFKSVGDFSFSNARLFQFPSDVKRFIKSSPSYKNCEVVIKCVRVTYEVIERVNEDT